MFCQFCGSNVPEDAVFCENCGKPVVKQQNAVPPVSQVAVQPMSVYNAPKMGFSNNINHASFQDALKKTKRGTGIFAVLLIIAPFVIALILSIKDDEPSYLTIGAVISLVFLFFNLIALAKRKAERQWEGQVIDQKTRTTYERNMEDRQRRSYEEYITTFRDNNGKKKTLIEGNVGNDAHPFYDYLNIGDRVRYYPIFNGFYEKYDKSNDTHIYCPACGTWTPVSEDYCQRCNTILLK